MSVWQKENIEQKIIDILKGVEFRFNPQHRFGRPFLTAYQLAIVFSEKNLNVVEQLNTCQEIGGEGSGTYNSLSQYLARQISGHYESMKDRGVEGAFLSGDNREDLVLDGDVRPSVKDISMFRYNKDLDRSIISERGNID
jgi:hypothetical protein